MVRAGNVRHVTTVGLDVPGRLAAWLLARAKEQQREQPGRREIAIGRSQGELAAELGTTRSTLNRALNGFEALGLLSRHGDRIVIRDVDALAVYTEEAGDFNLGNRLLASGWTAKYDGRQGHGMPCPMPQDPDRDSGNHCSPT